MMETGILSAVGTVSGVALGVAGTYWYKRLMSGNGSNGSGKTPFCTEHHHMVESVTKLCGEVKDGFGDMHDKINATREAVARIEGMLQSKHN
jgi:hypothetical protein